MTYSDFQRTVSLALILAGLLVAVWHTHLLHFATDTARLNHNADETRQRNLEDTYRVVHVEIPVEPNATDDTELSAKAMGVEFNETEGIYGDIVADDPEQEGFTTSPLYTTTPPPPSTTFATATETIEETTTTAAAEPETTIAATPEPDISNNTSSRADELDDKSTSALDFFPLDNPALTQNITLNSSMLDSIDH